MTLNDVFVFVDYINEVVFW